jgi:hypothetical protein
MTTIRTASALAAILCASGCGPSDEEKQACTAKKNEAAEAWGALGKALATEAESVRADLVRISQEAERTAVMEGAAGPPDPAAQAAARARMAPRIALAEARRAYVNAVDAAAGAAESLKSAYGGTAAAGVEAEAGSSSRFDSIGTTATAVADAIRGMPAAEQGSAKAPRADFAALRTTAQTAGQAALAACNDVEKHE